ncbi:hypothetical protein V7x_29460 [Crateriforma conspicua]|uniref:Uncharacterized protein n=1 Tax=Crateriforma conspicua TaxID=2527996 RepID=A0A5C6FW71_9PLAN|nr:hypothetical protein [Crateriforma conspicua]TWU67372.1 hypothetical protein V7x_29460 [Crateriforma conspicua]
MDLAPLAEHLLCVVRETESTPTLVVPDSVRLRRAFFAALAEQVARCADGLDRDGGPSRTTRLRIDALLPVSTGWRDRWMTMLRRDPSSSSESTVDWSIERPLMIGRQGGIHGEIVVGYAQAGTEFPAWVTPVPLCDRPRAA